jgi:tetratricopeptide (TPR) repeat protein
MPKFVATFKIPAFLLTCLLLMTGIAHAYADSTDEQLAAQYFRDGEYEKALALYEEIFNEDSSPVIYNNYLETLLILEEYRKAERLVNEQIDRFPNDIRFQVDIGLIYSRSGNERRERRHMEGLIQGLEADHREVIDLALAFEGRGFIDRALEALLRGRELLGDSHPLHLRIAALLEKKSDYNAMMEEYIDYLTDHPGDEERVRGILQDAIANDPGYERNDALRRTLLSRTQQEPGNVMYAEMLLWLSLQQQDFRMALMQARALDRRLQQEGQPVLEVARLSTSNQNYKVAADAYRYLLDKGTEGRFYMDALVGFLNVRFLLVTSSYDYEREDLLEIEQDYLQAIDELDIRAGTVQLVRNLANLQAFYLEKTDDAIQLLESTLELPNVSNRVRGECRVELADILLLTGEVWDATLLYSQVDRIFRDDPLAHEAKFKNARLSYFIGEFDWAKAQLDILKAGTSRLIANDAMRLSLRIQDNLGVNGDPEPLRMFARAEQYEFMNMFDEAFRVLDSIQTRFPGHQINDDILFARAGLRQKTNNYTAADSLLAAVVEIYPQGILADEALFRRAELYHYYFEEHDTAMSLYTQLLTDYPGSLHTITARARFRALRGDVVN